MARVHRDGQKNPVKIYRFMMAGGMDEKIYQRQVTKTGLADSVVDGKRNEASFSVEELRDLFRLDLNAQCQTHDLLGCDCKGLSVHSHPEPEEVIESEDDKSVIIESSEEESDDDLPLHPAYAPVPATKANVATLEKRIAEEAKAKRLKRAKGKMQALMSYVHIDTSIFVGETKHVFGYEHDAVKAAKDAIGDEVLVSVLKDERCKVGFVFAKKSKKS